MGYRSDIRIITSEKGFEELKKFVTKYLKEHNEDYNLLENCDIKQEGKKQCYFGWNYVKWYENDYEDVDAIMEGLQHLSDKEYSYRYMRIGEEYDDVEEQYCDGEKDKNIFLEYPSMIREFDDEYVKEQLKENDKIMIMGHTNPDIDAIGSALGIYRIAKTLEKEAKIVANVETPSIKDLYESIKDQYQEVFISSETALAQVDSGTLIIVVDTHKKTYVESPELLTKTNKIVIIDHHRRSADFIDNSILTFQEVYASSAAELVTEIIQYTQNEVELSEVEAEALYAGIMMDTKNFTFKTGVRTFEAAAYLRRCGVDIIKVKKWFQSDLESYNTISEIVRKAEIVRDSIGISIYDVQEKETSLICAKAADELLTIGNITASFVLGLMEDGKVCISGRSIGDVNVQMILEKLGGGGHITLAGAQLENVTIDEAKQELISKINEYFEEKE